MIRTTILSFCVLMFAANGYATSPTDACAESSPPGMTCQCTSVVEYKPSTHWEKFSEHVAAHLAFLKQQMQNGSLLLAGPFMDDGAGGTSIYVETSTDLLSQKLLGDPVLANDVATFHIRPWMMCRNAQ